MHYLLLGHRDHALHIFNLLEMQRHICAQNHIDNQLAEFPEKVGLRNSIAKVFCVVDQINAKGHVLIV